MSLFIICDVVKSWPRQKSDYSRKGTSRSAVRVYTVTLLILFYSGSKASIVSRDVTGHNDCEVICDYQPEFFNADCRSRDLMKIPPIAGACRAAKYLDARYNKIESISPRDFEQYNSTRVVQLGNNNITHIPENMCGNSTEVMQLQLNDNRIIRIPSKAFCKLSKLKHLALDNNIIHYLDMLAFDGLKSLTELYLTNNNLTALPDAVFKDLKVLDKLNLGKNAISEVTPAMFIGLRKLRYLDISENMITTIRKEVFNKVPNLSKLLLRGNALTSFTGKLFFGLPLLKTLDLSQNSIETFANIGAFLKQAIFLRQFYVQGNTLDCDCSLEPLRRWFRAHVPNEQSICASPRDMESTQLALYNRTLCKLEDSVIVTTSISTESEEEATKGAIEHRTGNTTAVEIVVYFVLALAVLTIVGMLAFCLAFRKKLSAFPPRPSPYDPDDLYEEPAGTLKPEVPTRSTSTSYSKAPIARQMSTGSATTASDITATYSRSRSKSRYSQMSDMSDIPEIIVDTDGQARIKQPPEDNVYQPLMSTSSLPSDEMENASQGSPHGTKDGYIQMKI